MVITAVRRLPLVAALACAGVLVLAGCGGGQRETIALAGPGAAAVPESTERAPLSIPPIYGLRPGQNEQPRQPAQNMAAVPPATGQDALLQAAGAGRADPLIRQRIGAGPGIAMVPESVLADLIAAPAGSRPGLSRPERLSAEPLQAE